MASDWRDTRMGRIAIGVAGGTCSGKSTLARMLVEKLGTQRAVHLSLDSYYHPLDHLPPEARARVNFDEPTALDEVRIFGDILDLLAGRVIRVPHYDFTTHTRTGMITSCHPAPVIVVDGILLLTLESVRPLLRYTVFVTAPNEVRLARRIARDRKERGRTEESVRHQWDASVSPMHLLHVEPSRAHADTIIDGTQPFNRVVEDVVRRFPSRNPAR